LQGASAEEVHRAEASGFGRSFLAGRGRGGISFAELFQDHRKMEHFTPFTALIGGALIGLATTWLWVANGRTAGISTIAGAILPAHRGEVVWRIVFLIGLPIGAWLGTAAGPELFAEIPRALPQVDLPIAGLVGAGLLVGIGTRLGRGCTSGHGICGLARLSPRSFLAVGTFMAAAVVTVFVTRHVL
jgi:uncharacterized membrane protein YedE/YeeE